MELHIRYDPDADNAPTLDFLVEKCKKFLPAVVPTGAQLKVRILTQRQGGKKLHERYLLTDIGCIKVDPGLDEREVGENFELIRLGQELYRDLWSDYASDKPSFDCAQEIPINPKPSPRR